VVLARNVIHSALFLILALLAVAGVFILLSAEFLAIVQLLIYGGAVIILVLFAMMLTRVRDIPQAVDGPQRPFAALAAGAFMGLSILAVVSAEWPGETEKISVIPLASDFADSRSDLTEPLDVSETGIDVDDGTRFEGGDTIRIDAEEMQVVAVLGNTLTVTRGSRDTTPATHATASDVNTLRQGLGDMLFRNWAAPFEVASLVLLVALIGGIILAREEEGE
jgi:NADH:ubiquinone oxidoreductase subunit 6 (subunit J)